MRDRDAGQSSLFGAAEAQRQSLPLVAVDDWPVHEKLAEEFAAIGFYLSGHPLDAYAQSLKRLGVTPYADLLADARRSSVKATLAGTLIRRQERRGIEHVRICDAIAEKDRIGKSPNGEVPESLAAGGVVIPPGVAEEHAVVSAYVIIQVGD
jgi:DNA polymerase III alpha subunit